jgi:hypothetical protein
VSIALNSAPLRRHSPPRVAARSLRGACPRGRRSCRARSVRKQSARRAPAAKGCPPASERRRRSPCRPQVQQRRAPSNRCRAARPRPSAKLQGKRVASDERSRAQVSARGPEACRESSYPQAKSRAALGPSSASSGTDCTGGSFGCSSEGEASIAWNSRVSWRFGQCSR